MTKRKSKIKKQLKFIIILIIVILIGIACWKLNVSEYFKTDNNVNDSINQPTPPEEDDKNELIDTKQEETKVEEPKEEKQEQKTDNNKKDENKKEETKVELKSETLTKPQTQENSKTYAKAKEVSGEKTTIGTTKKGYTIYEIDGITYIDGYMIVNKTYSLPSDYIPTNTYEKPKTGNVMCKNCIENTAYKAWKDMQADASAIGLNIYISSGYRSYEKQNSLYNNYVKRDGKTKADTYSARPGASEHQTGLCFDLNQINSSFTNTQEGKWVASHAYIYGYIIRYPEGKTNETGYKYESWHLRYVGTELSYKLYNNGNWITMEDYFGITSEYPTN